MDPDALLDGLNDAQRRAVTCEQHPLCVLAGAGSGKTRVLTRRIAWRAATGSADPRHVLALTFTRKAAGELGARLRALGVRDQLVTGTFHAVAYAQLRRRWADRGETPPALLTSKIRIIAQLMGRRDAAVQPADVAGEIEWAKARLVGPSRYERAAAAARRTPPMPAASIVALYEGYEEQKKRRGMVDFDDLLLRCALALERDAEFAAAQRWRFRHLFVDEFQDVNPLQARLLEAWRGGRDDLCVVGDPNQAIYGWNGADAGYLTGFRDRHEGAAVVRLDDNYRSTPQVLAVADAVLGGGTRATRPTRPMRAHRPDGPVPTVRSYPSDKDEARGIVRAVRDAKVPGTPWSHLAILVRTNAQAALFEMACGETGVPCRVKGGGAFLDLPAVRDALAELSATPGRAPIASRLDDLETLATGEGGDAERRLELDALVRLGHEYAAADPAGTVEGFRAWLDATVRSDEPDRGGDAVEIATFHRAKGLEWPVVFVAGVERGLVPIGHAEGPEAVAEERRLLYVALTRAEKVLHLSWAERRTFGTRTLTRSPSPWLDEVEAACAALAAGAPPGEWRRFIDAGRRQLQAAPRRKVAVAVGAGADPQVFEALKAWRAETARASGVPAFVIFHDATLAAVAEAKPRDRAALLALPGLGPVKAERYGDAVLAVVARHGRSA